jgi:membrane-bound serine protease (ClpP class)
MEPQTALTLAYALIASGILLALSELFFPTGGILLLLGGIAELAGVVLMFTYGSWENALMTLLALLIGLPALGGLIFYLYPYSPFAKAVAPNPDEDVTVANMPANAVLENLRGKIGKAVSPLRPSGIVEFDGKRVDCLTEGIVVNSGEYVKCIDVKAGKVIVTPTTKPSVGNFESMME